MIEKRTLSESNWLYLLTNRLDFTSSRIASIYVKSLINIGL